MTSRLLLQIVGADNPMLMAAAKQIFGAGGKRMRPALVFLVARATCQLSNIQYVCAFLQLYLIVSIILCTHYQT
jgi:geranylgeranyl pyrophosphate synthase